MNVSTALRNPQRNRFWKNKHQNLPPNPNHIGLVKFFDTIKGYGYISTDYGRDVYFHKSNICSSSLEAGDEVCFNLNASKRFPTLYVAVNLRKVYRSKDGQPIFDRINSHLHKGVEPLLGRIAEQTDCRGMEFIQQEVTFDEVVGENILVRLSKEDKVVYAIRKGRNGHTKFAINRKPEKCRTAAIVLKRVDEGYSIITAFIGKLSVPEPWDENATAESVPFWDNHALIYGREDVYEDTVTDVCPWGGQSSGIALCDFNSPNNLF